MEEKIRFINRELSWLSFNDRVLQEAEDPANPIIERIRFLGIFSSNLDEFFRVRVASLKRMDEFDGLSKKTFGGKPQKVLAKIQDKVLAQRHDFDRVYEHILEELAVKDIYVINEKQLTAQQGKTVRAYFRKKVRPRLAPIMVETAPTFPMLKDKMIYLSVKLGQKAAPTKHKYALIEVPTDHVSRFYVLPEKNGKTYIILLDDVIRYCLDEVFSIFDFDEFSAYTIKVTRDSELDIDDDVSESMLSKITKSLKQRKRGRPVRFIHDEEMPEEMLRFLMRKQGLRKQDNVIPGGRYHNFKDFMNFPKVGSEDLFYKVITPAEHPEIKSNGQSLIKLIQKKDLLLHYPYQSYDHVIELLREAAIDPLVVSIKITIYRLAENSNIVNALINAIRNGKFVTAVIELQARFDEEANIFWATRLREEGAKVIFGIPGLKVHSKLCFITRKERRKITRISYIGTGNFNENTAKLYSDHALLTCDERISAEVAQVFMFLENNYKTVSFKHLLVSPFLMRKNLLALIEKEITNAKAGKKASIILKMNSLVDEQLIEKLYAASRAGVEIRMIIRGICCLKTEVKGMSENINGISIVDRYLEHTRIFVFENGGDEKIYISSGDFMTRNLDFRVEVAVPIYNQDLKKQLKKYLEIQLSDNVKARSINKEQSNPYRYNSSKKIQAQQELYQYVEKLKPVEK
ncbi:MAG: polyphosphate kinase 1 [Bacteroidetes bacterium]|nr:polyphosphate kinase 1 [Bacteroidota bacterium]